MSTQVVELTGDEAALLRSLDKVIQKEREHERQLARSAIAGGNVGDELAEGFVRAKRESEKAIKAQIRELRKLGPEGKKAAEKLEQEMIEAGGGSEKAIKGILGEIRNLSPAAAKAADKIETNLGKGASNSTSAFTSFKETTVAQLTTVAGAYGGIHSAINKVIELNKQVKQTNEEAFDSLKSLGDAEGALQQIANDDRDFKHLIDEADRIAVGFGVDRVKAREVVFQARSEGFDNSIDFIASNSQFLPVEAQGQLAGKIRSIYRDSGVTGEQGINALLATTADSDLRFEDAAGPLAIASEGVVAAGGKLDEATALVTSLSPDFASPNTAGTRIKTLGNKFANDQQQVDKDGNAIRESLAGLGVFEGALKLQLLPEKQRRDFLGDNQEAIGAYNAIIRNVEKIKDQQQIARNAIETTGTPQSPSALSREIGENSQRQKSRRAVARSEIRLELERERRAFKEANIQDKRNNALSRAERQGTSGRRIAAAENAAGFMDALGYGEAGAPVISIIANDKLNQLRSDLTLSGGQLVDIAGARNPEGYLSLAVQDLVTKREDNPEAIVGRDSTAAYLREVTGDRTLLPGDVSDETRVTLSNAIAEAAGDVRGTASRLFSLDNLFGTPLDSFADARNAESLVRDRMSEILNLLRSNGEVTQRQEDRGTRLESFTDGLGVGTLTNDRMSEHLKLSRSNGDVPQQHDDRSPRLETFTDGLGGGSLTNDRSSEHLKLLRRSVEVAEKANDIAERNAKASEATAVNTKTKPDPGAAQRTAVGGRQ